MLQWFTIFSECVKTNLIFIALCHEWNDVERKHTNIYIKPSSDIEHFEIQVSTAVKNLKKITDFEIKIELPINFFKRMYGS